MGSFIDVVFIAGVGYAVWRSYGKGSVNSWLRFGYNVLGWGIATVYASKIAQSNFIAAYADGIKNLIANSNLAIAISAYSGSYTLSTNLPELLNELLHQHIDAINAQQEAILAGIQDGVVNVLVSLTCFLLIWLAVRVVFFIANKLIINNTKDIYQSKSLTGVLPAIGNALLCAMLLSGIIWPFTILFDKIGLENIWGNSVILRALANLFYKVQFNWFL